MNNLQAISSGVDEAENKINYLEHIEEKDIQSEQEEEKRIPPKEDNVRSLQDNFKRSNIHLLGVPEGGEKEQEIGNLSEKIVKENFPNLVKEIGMPGSTEYSNYDGCKEVHSKTHHY